MSADRRARSRGATRKRRRRRRARPGTARRRAIVFTALATVAGSLTVSVRRTAEGRSLAESIHRLRNEEQILLTRLSEEMVRVDSLSSRERILIAAARLGLRPATDAEILHLPDVGP